ncbi:hypothetical protein [Ferruginibacter sp. SUN106]|uniref:hypothetical protein n=1 Tax=Ferruginibacter sp. SUN106 TaxID=2978348 RepID=UPI003D35F5B6
MKKFSIIKGTTLFLGVMLVSASVLQCKKTGDVVKGLDRSFKGTSDTTLYASFYESNKVSSGDVVADVNDIVKFRGVQTILHEYCATSNCHGGPISPKFDTYTDVMRYVVAGNPDGSKLWEYITTNNFDKAMPPVNSNHELGISDKTLIYNWIVNGAKEIPDIKDFRPAAVALINNGCGSANCHNEATATGGWARKGLIPGLTAADTTQFTFTNQTTGAVTVYCLLSNKTIRDQVWNSYKDSVRKFYSDTLAYASFRPWKTFATPRSASSTRGPLQTYDDILLDINYPKSIRSNSSVVYTDPVTLTQYYVKGNFLSATSSLVSRTDSTLLLASPFTGIYATSQQGDMAYGDGGLKSNEVALIKAWYFADPNIPDVWKYGNGNVGIFKYRKTGNIIIKH